MNTEEKNTADELIYVYLFLKRSGNPDRNNKLLFPDRLNLLKNLIIKGAQALCRPGKEGGTL